MANNHEHTEKCVWETKTEKAGPSSSVTSLKPGCI